MKTKKTVLPQTKILQYQYLYIINIINLSIILGRLKGQFPPIFNFNTWSATFSLLKLSNNNKIISRIYRFFCGFWKIEIQTINKPSLGACEVPQKIDLVVFTLIHLVRQGKHAKESFLSTGPDLYNEKYETLTRVLN